MWADRVAEVRDLHPRLIRLFIQEYFDLLPERGRYHFEKLDESVDLILKTGAKPLMNIDFKPKLLYPRIDHKIVDPTSYEEWEQLIYNLVHRANFLARHFRKQNSTGVDMLQSYQRTRRALCEKVLKSSAKTYQRLYHDAQLTPPDRNRP